MNTIPAAVAAAIARVSETVPCLESCFSTVAVRYNPAADRIEIRHPDPACDCVTHPDGDAARELAEYVDAELRHHVIMAAPVAYGDLPLNVGAAS